MRAFPIRTALTLLIFALILACVSLVAPGVSLPGPPAAASITEFSPDTTPVWPFRPHAAPEFVAPARQRAVAPQILRDRDGSLDRFYAALWRTERGQPPAV